MPNHQPPAPQPHLWDGTPMAAMPYIISKGNDTPEHRVYEGMNMSEHKPGKLLRQGNTIYSLMHDGWSKGVETFRNRMYATVYVDREASTEEQEANARRLVACWNACDLMPTEDVERLAEIGEGVMRLSVLADDNRAERDRLSAINAELLKVATRVLRSFPTDSDMHYLGWDQCEVDEACNAYDAVRAAIAKAQGEQ